MTSTAITTINRRRLVASLAIAMFAVAPAAYARPVDAGSTDAHVNAPATQVAGGPTDLRSPDARDASIRAADTQVVGGPTDPRSPDARDAGRQATAPRGDAGYVGLRSPAVRDIPTVGVSATSRPELAPAGSSRPSWGILIGGVGVALILGMGLNETLRRHRPGHRLAITRG